MRYIRIQTDETQQTTEDSCGHLKIHSRKLTVKVIVRLGNRGPVSIILRFKVNVKVTALLETGAHHAQARYMAILCHAQQKVMFSTGLEVNFTEIFLCALTQLFWLQKRHHPLKYIAM